MDSDVTTRENWQFKIDVTFVAMALGMLVVMGVTVIIIMIKRDCSITQ